MPNDTELKAIVKGFVLDEVLPGEDPDELTETTPLMTTGILNSMTALRLVAFLEERFGIALGTEEIGPQRLNTIQSIADLVRSKLKGSAG